MKESVGGWLFAMPLIIGMAVFTIYPIIQSFIYSFYNYNGGNVIQFVGFGNYIRMFTTDKEFLHTLANTFLYTVINVPLSLVLGYLLAVLVTQKIKGITGFRVLYYMPVVIPGVVSGVLWKELLHNQTGAFNQMLRSLGLPLFPFFSSASTSMFSLIFIGIWGIGGSMVLWIAALKNIPSSMYEAAKLDGAGVFVRLFDITIPMTTPMIFYNLIMAIIGSLQINSPLLYVANGKGVNDCIYFISVKIFNDGFMSLQLGYASAMAWVLFLIIGIFTLIIFKTSKWVFYGEDA